MITFLIVLFASQTFATISIEGLNLKKTIEEHNEAKNYLAWETSTTHPHLIFDELEKQNYSPVLVKLLCDKLELLSIENRRIFLGELLRHKKDLQDTCFGSIYNFFEREMAKAQDTKEVKEYRAILFAEETSNSFKLNSTSKIEFASLGPSEVVELDPTGGPVFYYGEKGRLKTGEFALTFDDGPHPVLTDKLLSVLASESVKATFFIVGQNAKKYPEIVQRVLRDGHTIATHSFSHKQLPKLETAYAEREIQDGFNAAQLAVDLVAPFFRFPYGSKSNHLVEYLKLNDLASFFWDVDTLDWKMKNYDELLEYALRKTHNAGKGIILFHDIQPQTIGIMPQFLRELKKANYKTVVYKPTQWMEKIEPN